MTETSISLAKVMSSNIKIIASYFFPASKMSKMFLLYSFILSPASEKVDLSETAVSSLLSGEIGAMVVDHVALLSCP